MFLDELKEELEQYSDRVLEQAVSETNNGTYNQIRNKLYEYQQELTNNDRGMDDVTESELEESSQTQTLITIQVVNDAITKLDNKMQNVKPFAETDKTSEVNEPEDDTDDVLDDDTNVSEELHG
ncbi:hypothetical protein SEP9_094 [Staphylococcus phage vB_SepS_SEP9]|uniref:Uncharacterized protein n=1 Tax=Staphylococcus phage vB_SepS_SEP9 TaxID=1434319 RepID=W5RVC9_9CAUD|nr:hypothetical protein SEP9_094 [Staphylococcus phage vB_SepS_SEP9]AHG24015.1 hypothetical protein SEP9_094 [Staphylococcus phage vB_SepS_SEP9]